MKKALLTGLIALSIIKPSISAVFIIPPDWDDIKQSVTSSNVYQITESSYVSSNNSYSYTLKDQQVNVTLKCVNVPKIPCSTGNIKVYGVITGMYLVKNNSDKTYSMPNLKKYDLLAEDAGSSFNVCAPIIANDWGSFFMNYDYYTKTNQGSKNDNSYVNVQVWQVCR